jgi:hypothetical protein
VPLLEPLLEPELDPLLLPLPEDPVLPEELPLLEELPLPDELDVEPDELPDEPPFAGEPLSVLLQASSVTRRTNAEQSGFHMMPCLLARCGAGQLGPVPSPWTRQRPDAKR